MSSTSQSSSSSSSSSSSDSSSFSSSSSSTGSSSSSSSIEIPSGSFAISLEEGEGAHLEAPAYAYPGERVDILINLELGYELKSISVNEEEIGFNNGHADFEMPECDVTVSFETEKLTYSLFLYGDSGVFLASDKSEACYGDEVTVAFTLSENHVLDTITLNGEALEPDGSGVSFTMPNEDAYVRAESTLEKGILEAPGNVSLNGSLFTFDPVTGADNGYQIRVNEDNSQVYATTLTQVDILDTPLADYLTTGSNYIDVRAEGTSDSYVSEYSEAVEYVHGVDNEAVLNFISKVNAIGDVSLTDDCLAKIDAAREAYLSLDDVSLLDRRVSEAKETFDEKDGTYFLLLTQTAEATESDSSIQNAADYYNTKLLDKNSSWANEALSIAIKATLETKQVHYEDCVRLYMFSFGENVLGDRVPADKPVVYSGESEIEIQGSEGAYYLDMESDVEISFQGESLGTFEKEETLPGCCFGIVTSGAFGSNAEGYDRFAIDVFEASSISEDYLLSDMPLTTLYVEYGTFDTNQINKALYRLGYGGMSMDLTIMIYAENSNTGAKTVVNDQSFADLSMDVMDELRLSNFGEIYTVTDTTSSTYGRLVWPWEIFMENANDEASEVKSIEVSIIDADGNVCAYFSIVYGEVYYTYKEDIESILAQNGLGSGSYCFSAYLKAVEGSEYSDSLPYPTTEYCDYEVSE